MPQYGTWSPYVGGEAILLAFLLVIVAGVLAYLGARLHHSVGVSAPGRLYPPPTTQLTLLFFLPLFLVEISSFTLLTLSPLINLSRYTLFALAAMFFVFAIWALFGFSYPSNPISFALNAVSKILSFVVAVTLFLPEKQAVKMTLPGGKDVPNPHILRIDKPVFHVIISTH